MKFIFFPIKSSFIRLFYYTIYINKNEQQIYLTIEEEEIWDAIKITFSPSKGHEQKGYRPGLVISRPSYPKTTEWISKSSANNSYNK